MMPFCPDGHGRPLGVVLSVRSSGPLADKPDKVPGQSVRRSGDNVFGAGHCPARFDITS